MTFATSEPVGSAPDRVRIEMSMLQELASDGTVLGGGGNAKHSFNSFATQSFTFGSPVASTIAGVSSPGENGTAGTAKNYSVTKVVICQNPVTLPVSPKCMKFMVVHPPKAW